MARVGVVVPAFQVQRWLALTLDSLLAQTVKDWVCVVVDDGSTDDTAWIAADYARRDPRITTISQANRGLPGARNSGLRVLPDVDYIAFLDADDLWLPNTLAVLSRRLDQRPDAVGAYGLAEYVDETGARHRPGEHPRRQHQRRRYVGGRWRGHLVDVAPTEDLTLAELAVGNPMWPPATALFRASAIHATGPFDETYRVQEDWQMWLRLSQHGPIAAIATTVVDYRQHGNNLTRDWHRNYVHQDRLRRQFIDDPVIPTEARALALAAWRCQLREAAGVELRRLARQLYRGRPKPAVSAAVRTVWPLIEVLRPGGPRPSDRAVRWRPRPRILEVDD
jgi:glycosyltransferase involved in cell wall biosynthesis